MVGKSDNEHLSSRHGAEELLKCVLEGTSASLTYLIIDGLDECATVEDITNVIDTISRITEPFNIASSQSYAASPGAFRLIFTSTDEQISIKVEGGGSLAAQDVAGFDQRMHRIKAQA